MLERKKIYAIISYPFLPATSGGEISTLNLLSFLGKVNQVEVFTVEPYKHVDESSYPFNLQFGMRFHPLRYLNLFLLFKILGNIRKQGSDYIFFDQPFMGWMIPLLRVMTGKPVFLRSNNIEYQRFRSLNKSWWSLLYLYERYVYRASSLVVFVSDIDREQAIREFGLRREKTLLTPYGVPQSQLPNPVSGATQILQERHGIDPKQKILLFFATLNYRPNEEAVEYIIKEIEPRLQRQLPGVFKILICGKNLPKSIQDLMPGNNSIQYLGFVEDIETYIDGAVAMINPILSGGGVKTKAVDTLGRGQVVISTAKGAEGIDPRVCGSNLRIAPDQDWDAFVELIIQQANPPDKKLPQDFFATYSWPGIIENLMQKLQTIQEK